MDGFSYPLAFLGGIVVHLLWFQRGEHHMISYPTWFVVINAGIVAALHTVLEHDISTTLRLVAKHEAVFLAALSFSTLTWRAFINQLNKFPGPFVARLTRFWWPWHIAVNKPDSQSFRLLGDLHQKYGPIVHLGPDLLSIADPDAPNLIYGNGSKCSKAAWYDSDYPRLSLHTSRVRALHDKRRRVWSPAFSDKALRGYEHRVLPYADALVRRIGEYHGNAVNVAAEFNFFAYDVMGNLAFGKDFGMLSTGEEHFAVHLLNDGMQPMAFLLPSWFFRLLAAIPGLASGFWKFIYYCNDQLASRINSKPDVPDIMSALLAPFGGKNIKGRDLNYLQGDARLIIVAGSDTTSTTLVHIFYHLAQRPDVVKKLRKDLEPYIDADGVFDNKNAGDAAFLNGVIHEALRLHPAVPSGLLRLTPPEGLQIGPNFVPGNTEVMCPTWAIGRSAEAYVDPEAFVPERWSTKPDMIKRKSAFHTFSLGPMGCIGRPLALMELRLVVAKLITTYDVTFAPTEKGTDLFEKSRDHFTLEPGPLNLSFRPLAKA